MTAEEVYAVILNRGLTPSIGLDGSLVLEGGKKGPLSGHSRILQNAIRSHESALKRLVAAQWMPPTDKDKSQRSGVAPVAAESKEVEKVFDQDAEKLVRDLYAFDYGIKWDRGQGKFRIVPAQRCPRLDQWWKRAKPMWDRIVSHLTNRDAGSLVLEFRHRDRGRVTQWRQREPIYDTRKTNSDDVNGEAEKGGDRRILVEAGYLHTSVTQEVHIKHCKDCDHPFEHAPYVLFDHWRYMGEPGGYWRCLWGRYVDNHGNAMRWLPWGCR